MGLSFHEVGRVIEILHRHTVSLLQSAQIEAVDGAPRLLQKGRPMFRSGLPGRIHMVAGLPAAVIAVSAASTVRKGRPLMLAVALLPFTASTRAIFPILSSAAELPKAIAVLTTPVTRPLVSVVRTGTLVEDP